jgi:putative ABC transport system permease protein
VGFGTLPALRASQTMLTDALKSGGRGTAGGVGQQRMRGLLVVSQVALTIVLLTAAALFLKSFARLQSEPIGFRSERLLTARSGLPGERYAANPARVTFVQQLLEEIRRQPGLQEAAVVSRLPFATGNETYRVNLEGAPEFLNGVAFRACTPDYFRVLGVTLLQGRGISELDDARAPRVVVINDVLARKLWPNESPLGRRIQETSNDRGWREVVGVVSSVRHRSKAIPPAAEMFVPWTQTPGRQLNIVVRTPSEPEVFGGTLRRAFATIDSELALYEVRTMEERLSDSVAQPRFRTTLISVFAAIALVMAVVGLYGTMAYSVSQRTQEFGVRMALGAQPRDVLGMVLTQGIKLTLAGVAVGVVAALALTRLIERMLHGVTPTDPLTFAAVPLLLIAAAVVACWRPAHRATKVDPMVALRAE